MTGTPRALALTPALWRQRLAMGLAAVLVGAFALLARPAQASDDPPGRVGRITESRGQAWQWDPEGGEWVAVQRNRPVTSGDRLSVEGDGRLELRIGSTTVRLDGGTEIEMRRLDDERIEMQLFNGSAAVRVRSAEVAREVEVVTEEGRFMPRRAGHYRIDRRDDTSIATTWSGSLRFESADSALAVPAGRSAEFWHEGGQRTHYSWVESRRDEFSDWVARDNREDDRSASAQYVSPEMTGWEDLDRHGRWETHPEYGALWYPSVVVAGWAPYRYGHWAWVRPWGWTWIDDAPWGFAPFHYGRWVMWGGRWCWAPGVRVARPVYAPALVAWVGGPAVSVGVTVGPAPVVGWVPLAPREVYRPYYPKAVSAVYLRGVNAGHPTVQPPSPRVPPGPIMYTNQGVPGAVTVVPSNVLSARRPVAPAVAQVDVNVRNDLARQPAQRHDAPPPPTRLQAAPVGAVPAVGPGARPGGRAVAPPPPQSPVQSAVSPSPQAPAQPGPQTTGPMRPQPGPAAQPGPQVQPGAPASPGAEPRRERIPQRPGAVVPQPAPSPQAMPPAPGQPPAVRDRRGDDGRGPQGARPAPVRVEPPRAAAPAQPAPPAQPAMPARPAMPSTPPAAREVQRVQIPQRAEHERGRGQDERRQPTAPRNQNQ